MAARTTPLKTVPLRRRLAIGLAVGLGAPALIQVLIFDAVLGMCAYVLVFSVILTFQFRLAGLRRAAALAAALLVCAGVTARFVSPCKFVVCRPATWEEQLAAAQREIDTVSPGFFLADVWAWPDTTSRYRTEDELRPNLLVTFEFMHAPKPGQDGEFAYSVRLSDRDPSRPRDVVPGYAYGGVPAASLDLSPLRQIRISPTEAVERVNRARSPGPPVVEVSVHLQLPDRPGAPPVWAVRHAPSRTIYYVSAADGTVTSAPEP